MIEADSPQRERTGFRLLDWIERIGNKLPDPVILFMVGALLVLVGSHVAVMADWSAVHPTTGVPIEPKSLLAPDGMQWVWLHLVENFTGFHPLGVVLVAMLGIGVAERTGMIGALLKLMVLVTPQSLLTPAVVFVGVMSSMAVDAGYVVLPPLAAALYAKAGRAPLAGLAAVFAGVAAGFSANLLPTSLDALLAGLTQEAANLLDPNYTVAVTSNWYFMIVSTGLLTLVGWGATRWFVERRFTREDIANQIAAGAVATGGDDHRGVTYEEKRGLIAAAVTFAIAGGIVAALALVPGWPLHGDYEKGGDMAPVWSDAIVPMLFVLFLLPGVAHGIASSTVRRGTDVARMMGESMAGMGSYIVLAFFAGQFVAWFRESNLGFLIAIEGVEFLRRFDLSATQLVIAIVLLVAVLNLFLGSASAKWALLSPVFVPLFMGLGISPELTQAAYRVGDSTTNAIAPLNPYLVIILVFMQRYMPRAGLGSLVSLMLPYTFAFLIAWLLLLWAWMWIGIPLGPDDVPLTYSLPAA